MAQSIDHIVIAVRDLAAATADYAAAGFTVTPGGEHTGGDTHNALISFADGAYFELIAFREPDRPQPHRWWPRFAHGEGTVDFALLSDDLAAEAARIRQAGLAANGPNDGGRLRPDGQRLAWRSLMLDDAAAPLPFVIEDVTARDLRVPPGAATVHPLGVSGVAGVVLAVDDLDRAAASYAAFLGAPGEDVQPSITGAHRARRFPLGQQWIELAAAAPEADALHRHRRERGSGPYDIVLTGPAASTLPAEKLHGARVRVTEGDG